MHKFWLFSSVLVLASSVFAGNHIKLVVLKCFVLNPELLKVEKCFVKAVSRHIGTFNLVMDLARAVYAPIEVNWRRKFLLASSASVICFRFGSLCSTATAQFSVKSSKHQRLSGAALTERSRSMCSLSWFMICLASRLHSCSKHALSS